MIRIIHSNGAYTDYWQTDEGVTVTSDVGGTVLTTSDIATYEALTDLENALRDGARLEYRPDPA